VTVADGADADRPQQSGQGKTAGNGWSADARSEDRQCRQCNGPFDGTEELCSIDGKSVWLHPECHRFYVDRVYR
jgi:hypothetical protein